MAKQNKEEQKRILTELMEADQKNGLYDHIGDTNKMVTAVESFAKELIAEGFYIPKGIYDRAKEIEKEQIMDDFNAGQWAWAEHLSGKEKKDPLEYYNETYKSND